MPLEKAPQEPRRLVLDTPPASVMTRSEDSARGHAMELYRGRLAPCNCGTRIL